MERSIRSRRGPDNLPWYLWICFGVHLQRLVRRFESRGWVFKLPHGQLFIAARRRKSHGYFADDFAREIVMKPSSSGCLRTSRTWRGNSVISSRKRTPLWARVISPGLRFAPPPVIAMRDAV